MNLFDSYITKLIRRYDASAELTCFGLKFLNDTCMLIIYNILKEYEKGVNLNDILTNCLNANTSQKIMDNITDSKRFCHAHHCSVRTRRSLIMSFINVHLVEMVINNFLDTNSHYKLSIDISLALEYILTHLLIKCTRLNESTSYTLQFNDILYVIFDSDNLKNLFESFGIIKFENLPEIPEVILQSLPKLELSLEFEVDFHFNLEIIELDKDNESYMNLYAEPSNDLHAIYTHEALLKKDNENNIHTMLENCNDYMHFTQLDKFVEDLSTYNFKMLNDTAPTTNIEKLEEFFQNKMNKLGAILNIALASYMDEGDYI